ncbi:MAG: ADP-glyceromanno-heptose 6-epimerase [Aquificae bacterium]|nr:ADP-glyceromanno-heptose 6-epimerase [Aquificota bacterium]
MEFLVTGGAGFIGSNLVRELLKRYPEARVVVLDDFSSGHFKNLVGLPVEVVTGDLSDRAVWDELKRRYRFDAVFHQGAITDTTVEDQYRMMRVNADSMRLVLEAALEWGAKVIYASSAGVYGNTPPPMREDRGLLPENVYGFSKLTMDRIAERFAREHPELQVTGLRYFNVYGPHEEYKGRSASMVLQLALQMLKGRRPRLFKWGQQKRDFVYVKDAVKANLLALERGVSGVFNVGTGRARSFNELVEILNRELGTSYEPEYFDCPYDFYQEYTEADLTRARELLDYEPEWSLEEGVKDYLPYVKRLVR